MIRFTQGDIFASGCQALVNPVNCVGVMGKGLALQFKRRFPANFASYAEACRAGEVMPGLVYLVDTGADQPRFIVNFPTKRHWRDPSRLNDIAAGLHSLHIEIYTTPIHSIAIPPLGCGLGGLPWTDVRPLILRHLSSLDHTDIIIYGPAGS